MKKLLALAIVAGLLTLSGLGCSDTGKATTKSSGATYSTAKTGK
jgi:hypothetical protein